MPFNRSFKEEADLVRMITTGSIDTVEEYLDKLKIGTLRLKQLRPRRVLVDDTELTVNLDVLDVSLGAADLEKDEFSSLGIRAAALYRPEHKGIYRVIETAYRNRSINYRLFESEEEALAWLRS